MIKILLGISIVAFTSFCGYVFSGKYRKRKSFFRQFNEFNERFLSEISYYRRPIADFISQYSYKEDFDELLRLFYGRISSEEDERKSFIDETSFHFLSQEEKLFVDNYFSSLASTSSICGFATFSTFFLGFLFSFLISCWKKTSPSCD